MGWQCPFNSSWEPELAPAVYALPQFWSPQSLGQAHMLTQKLSTGPEGPQAEVTSFPGSEITKNADISEVSPVAVGVEAEQEGPLEGDEAPDAGEVVAGCVYETCRGAEPMIT